MVLVKNAEERELLDSERGSSASPGAFASSQLLHVVADPDPKATYSTEELEEGGQGTGGEPRRQDLPDQPKPPPTNAGRKNPEILARTRRRRS